MLRRLCFLVLTLLITSPSLASRSAPVVTDRFGCSYAGLDPRVLIEATFAGDSVESPRLPRSLSAMLR
jgi:hypothetical protein